MDVNFKLTAEGFGEELSPGLKSIREALVNMLIHADYFSPARPRIRIFTNHIEYYNPGGFPKPIEELKGKDLSIPRNPILAKLFRMVKLAENAGYGLDNIENNWKEYNGSSVEYVIDFDSTIVRFETEVEDSKSEKTKIETGGQKGGQKISLTKRQKEVITLIDDNPKITRKELAEKFQINESAVQKHIVNLKEKNVIKRIGGDRGGYWKVTITE